MLYPKLLNLEVTNRCNGNCVYCGRKGWKIESVDMPFDTVKELIDKFPKSPMVHLTLYGESLLYPYIVDAVEYSSARNKYVWITTNGQLLDESMSKSLLKAGVNKIIVSIDTIDSDLFNTIRRGLDYDTISDNVHRFVDLRNQYGYSTVVIVNMVNTKDYNQDMVASERYWRKVVDGVSVVNEVYCGPIDNLFLSVDKPPVYCPRANEHLTVRANGDVVLCCRDCHVQYSFGNVNDDDPYLIFNSDKFNEIRNRLITGKNRPTLCDNCGVPAMKSVSG